MKRIEYVIEKILGFVLILIGVITLNNELLSLMTISMFLAVTLIVDGIKEIYVYFKTKNILILSLGIITLLVSALLLRNGIIGLSFSMPYIFAIWVIYMSIIRLQISIDESNTNLKITSVLGIFVGIILLINPYISILSLVYLLALSFFISGLTYIFK